METIQEMMTRRRFPTSNGCTTNGKQSPKTAMAVQAILDIARVMPGDVPSTCPKCDGSGYIKTWENGIGHLETCPICAERKAHEARLANSGISKEDYEAYTLDTFKRDTECAAAMGEVADRFINTRKPYQGCGFFGKPGTGKTHICIAICQALKLPHYYWQYRAEIQRIKNSAYKNSQVYDELIVKPSKASLLFVDDLFKGAIINGGLAPQDQQIMFDIINRRYMNRLPTIFSSEYSLDKITSFDEAIGSRIAEMCRPFNCKCQGKNRRLS